MERMTSAGPSARTRGDNSEIPRMAGGRPKKTLLERVLTNSFRPKRYAHLLAGDLLPEQPPSRFRGRAKAKTWAKLREWQREWQLEVADRRFKQAADVAHEFSLLVLHLHGSSRPEWLR
jgi:hypothetical protein